MHGFNSLKCSVTPDFLLIDHFLYRLSTFYEKLKKTVLWKFVSFLTFLPMQDRIPLIFWLHGVGKSPFHRLSLTGRMTPVQIIYLTDPLKWNLSEEVDLERIIFNIFQLASEAMSSYENRFVKIGVVFHALYFENEVGDPHFFCISDIHNSLSDCSKSMKKTCVVGDFSANDVLKFSSRHTLLTWFFWAWITWQKMSNPKQLW